MMEINGLSNGALATTVPIVGAGSVGVVGLSKENGHGHLHHHHGVETDSLMVSMKLDPSAVGHPHQHQVHLGQAENGVNVATVTGVQAQEIVNNVVMANAAAAAAAANQIAVNSVQQQQQQQQLKTSMTVPVPVQVTTASTGTDTGGGGGLMGNAGQGLLGQGGMIVQTTQQQQQQQQQQKESESTGGMNMNQTTTINQTVTSQPASNPVTTTIATGGGISIVPTSSVNNSTSSSSGGGAGYENKLFVGGLSWQTSSEKLREYFGKFGQVLEVQVVVDPMTQRSRGFGFITFADSDTVRKIVSVPNHILDGKRIDPKHATPRNKQVPAVNTYKTKKIFVGGVSQDTTLDEIKSYFGQFGKVEDAVMLMDQQTMRHRGFGFVTFESDEVVERICEIHYHTIKDKKVECKKAKPKEAQALQVPGVGVSAAGLHHAFGHDAATAAALGAHHLSLATTALGAQRTTPAAYAAFYGGHLGLSSPAAHQPHHHQTAASIGNHLAAMPGGLGLIPTTMATAMVSAAPGPVTYSTIRSGLARYTPYPVRNWNGNAAAAAAAAAAAVLAPPPPTASAPQIPTGPSPSLLSLSATPSQAQAANNAAFAAYHHAHHAASLSSATPTAPSGASTLTAAANTPTLDFAGIAGIPTAAVTGPSIPAATFDWSGVYHV